MSLGDFFKDVGHAAAKGVSEVSSGLNTVDRYINPFHTEQGSASDEDKAKYNSLAGNTVTHQVENASRGMSWLYDNGISQPLSAAMMVGAGKHGMAGAFSANDWSQAWHAANHISPAQALFLDPNQTEKAITSPLRYFKPDAAYLPPGFEDLPDAQQQAFLKQAGMPVTGNAYIEELRKSSAIYKNATGVGDFAVRWWADPVILGGKALSAERKLRQVVKRPPTGWSSADIDKIMNKSVMAKAQEFIYANRANPTLLNNLSMARNSALGPRFGAVASTLRTPDEVDDFLRIGMGDVDAIERLGMKNTLAGSRIEQDTARLSRLKLQSTSFSNNPPLMALVQGHMDQLQKGINADTELVKGYEQVLGNAHKLDQINLSRWSFARAQQTTDAQAAYRASTARGGKAARNVTITPTPVLSFGAHTPVDLGLAKSRLYGLGDFFSTPVTVVRSFSNFRPNGYMRIDDIDNAATQELRGQLARIPGIKNESRIKILNDYLKTTTEGQRIDLLDNVGRMGAAKVAQKHGLEASDGVEIYKKHLAKQVGERDNLKRYSAATKPITLPDGTVARVHVDEFAEDGGKLVVHPNLASKLANGHVFQDLDEMDKVLARHSSALRALRESRLGNPDWMLDGADYLTSLFKFGTLFRLGYIPRVLGDDLTGQWARLGSAAMAMRFGWGVRNGATNASMWLNRPFHAAQHEEATAGAAYAAEKMAEIRKDMVPLKQQIGTRRAITRNDLKISGRRLAAAKAKRAAMDPAVTSPARMNAMDALIAKHQAAVTGASRSMGTGVAARNIKLRDLEAHHAWLDSMRKLQLKKAADAYKAAYETPKAIQGSRAVNLGNGVKAPAAFEGPNGEYYMKNVDSDEVLGQFFRTNKEIVHGHMMRSFDHGGKAISANTESEALHATSWAHAINNQIMQDELGRMAVKGANVQQMTDWLEKTAAGRIYRERLGLKMTPSEEFANAAWHEVNEYMPLPEIRMKALEPKGVTPTFLKESMPMAQRPEVHTGQVGVRGQIKYRRALDDVKDKWFKVAASIPANRMSRHPLFNQLYEGHMKILKNQLVKQGAFDTTVEGLNTMATTARSLALRDTRKLVFDIAHRSDAAAAMRFISPFMAATNESFQRWGRIIADNPQTVGYANNLFNAPIAKGAMQDADGNHITKDGYANTITYPLGADGKPDYTKPQASKHLVPKSERYIIARMPTWLVHNPVGQALGADPANGKLKLSQNSMDVVTQGDPWFSPGVGPIVQIPVNEVVKDKPAAAELARHLDILPFGPQQGTGLFGSNIAGRTVNFFAPSTVKNFLTAFDTSDDRYQSVKLQMIQRAAYEHDNLGKPMPSAKQIADQVRNYWMFSAASAFLQPMATQKADKYQFYRDQYNALRRANPLTADDEFLSRFGESYFIFAQAQSKNESGIPSTKRAVELSKKYSTLIQANPELGSLIVGPEGNGPFSPEAYSYQLNTPLTPGGSEMQRSKMSADDAMVENQKRAGWAKYSSMVTQLTNELHKRGLKSFNDKGAADLKQAKSNFTHLWSQPLKPNGDANPYYNEEWSKDFSTLDPLKYDRLIPGMRTVADSDLAKDPNRSDLRILKTYLQGRDQLNTELAARGKKKDGAKTITAKKNADLADRWQRFVDNLIESDTRFGELHSRYLSRDMGYDNTLAPVNTTDEEQA